MKDDSQPMSNRASIATTTAHAVPASVARSWLLRPVTAVERATSEEDHDVLVLDLEDAVPESEKDTTRVAVAVELIRNPSWVRINDVTSPHWQRDLDALSGIPQLAGVMLAKAETASDVDLTASRLPSGIPIVPMIESAAALQQVEEIASHPAVLRLAFGVGDFMKDTGISADPMALIYARTRLVIASVAAGIASPIDGPAKGNPVSRRVSLAHSRAMGMTGALVLDPSVLELVNHAFSPTVQEIGWARAIIDRPHDGPRDGSYAPELARAKKILDLHRQLSGAA